MNCVENILSQMGIGGRHYTVAPTNRFSKSLTSLEPRALLITAVALFAITGVLSVAGTVLPFGIFAVRTVCLLGASALSLYALFKCMDKGNGNKSLGNKEFIPHKNG